MCTVVGNEAEGAGHNQSRAARSRRPTTSTAHSSSENDANQTAGVDRIEQMRGLLRDLHVSDEALRILKPADIAKLSSLSLRGEATAGLIISMVNEVAKTTPGKLPLFLDTMTTYDGSMSILNTFLTQVGNRNPFIAAERALIQVLPAAEGGSVRGASGHILKGITYCAFDPEAPSSTVGYISAKQAITRIFAAFHPERFTEQARQRVASRRNKVIVEELGALNLEGVTLQELDANPTLAEGIRSQLIVRNLEVYQELRRAIAEYGSSLASQVYGGNVILPAINSLKVASDPGRQLWGWFEEHFRENPSAPQGIRVAYASLRDPDIELSEAEEQHYIQGLLAYQRLNSFINKSVALHGLISDLKTYDSLPVDHPLRLNPEIESARQVVQRKIGETATELTMSEFSTMLENAAMVDFRRTMNAGVLDRYGQELQEALAHFEFVSFENNTWREDALSDSVPMERLKKHIYGAKIGVLKSTDADDRKRGVLGQPDFKHIMDAQFLTRLVADQEKLLNAKPVSEFKEMVEGVIVAYRKARFFDAELERYKNTPTGAAVEVNPHDVGDALSRWKPVLPLGGKYKPAEAWALETKDPKPRISDLREVVQRFKDGKSEVLAPAKAGKPSKLKEAYQKVAVAVDTYAQAGLYLPEMDDLWRRIESKVRGFTPSEQLLQFTNEATALAADPMVVLPSGYLRPEQDILLMLRKRFLSEKDIATLRKFVEAKDQISGVSDGFDRDELAALRARINTLKLHDAIIYKGSEGTYESGKGKLSLESRWFREIAKPKHHPSLSWIAYYEPGVDPEDVNPSKPGNPRTLKEKVDAIEASTVSLGELGEEWCRRARRLCSRDGKAALGAQGFLLVETATFQAAQGLFPRPDRRVTKNFVALVDRLMPAE